MSELNLEELRQQFADDPENEELRLNLIMAIMKSGDKLAARKLVYDRFHCSIPWERHSGRPHSQARHCETCNKTVHFANSEEELEKLAGRNRSLVAPRPLVEKYCDGLANELGEGKAREISGPQCLSMISESDYDLADLEHYPEPIQNWSGNWPFLPMRLISEKELKAEDSTLVLVATLPPDSESSEQLLTVLGYKSLAVLYVSNKTLEQLQRERHGL